jgi:hypothetical protein
MTVLHTDEISSIMPSAFMVPPLSSHIRTPFLWLVTIVASELRTHKKGQVGFSRQGDMGSYIRDVSPSFLPFHQDDPFNEYSQEAHANPYDPHTKWANFRGDAHQDFYNYGILLSPTPTSDEYSQETTLDYFNSDPLIPHAEWADFQVDAHQGDTDSSARGTLSQPSFLSLQHANPSGKNSQDCFDLNPGGSSFPASSYLYALSRPNTPTSLEYQGIRCHPDKFGFLCEDEAVPGVSFDARFKTLDPNVWALRNAGGFARDTFLPLPATAPGFSPFPCLNQSFGVAPEWVSPGSVQKPLRSALKKRDVYESIGKDLLIFTYSRFTC